MAPIAVGTGTSDASSILVNSTPKVNGRSPEYPCWYRVGSIGFDAVYWHPFCGFAREKDHSYLVELAALSGVVWDISDCLIRDVYESGGLILEAMGVDLREVVLDYVRTAIDCARSKSEDYERAHVAYTEVF